MMNFEYHNPCKIYFGPAEFEHLASVVKSFGKTVLVTYGGGSIKKTGLYQKIMARLEAANMNVVELGGIDPNPRIESVREGGRLCKEHNVNVVLAVGGGSTIDCSKFICASAKSDLDPWEWFTPARPQIREALPLVTVLTLAATGSEMDAAGVITNPKTNEKIGRMFNVLLPKASFLNPEDTFTVPAFQTAAGSADIMSHAMETYFGQGDTMFFLDTFIEGLLRTVIKYAPIAMKEPKNYEARANLMWASTWAINGFIRATHNQEWTVHAIEHELSGFYDITHGLGLAILTPEWMRYVLKKDEAGTLPKLIQFAENVFGITSSELSAYDKAVAGIDALENFFVHDLKLAPTLHALNIGEEHFKEMAERAVAENGVIHGFVDIKAPDVEAIYKASL